MTPIKPDECLSYGQIVKIYTFFKNCHNAFTCSHINNYKIENVDYHLLIFDKREITSEDYSCVDKSFNSILHAEVLINYYNPRNKIFRYEDPNERGDFKVHLPELKNREFQYAFTYPSQVFLENIKRDLGLT